MSVRLQKNVKVKKKKLECLKLFSLSLLQEFYITISLSAHEHINTQIVVAKYQNSKTGGTVFTEVCY